MTEARRVQRDLVLLLKKEIDSSLSEVANQAGVDPTTLTRFVSSKKPDAVLSTATWVKVQRLAASLGLSAPAAQAPTSAQVNDGSLLAILGGPDDGTAPKVGEGLYDPNEIAFVALWRRLKTNENRLRFLLAGFGLTGKADQSGHG